MTRCTTIMMGALLFAGVFFAGGLVSSDQSEPSTVQDAMLAKLDPENLESYLLAGESIGARARSKSEKDLGSQVLAIGIGLADRQGNPQLAASMCIALAANEPDADMASTLWDLALMFDPRRSRAWVAHRDQRANEQAQLRQDAARCLYAARYNDPKLANQLLGRKDVREIIQSAARQVGLNPSRFDRQLAEIIAAAGGDECRGRVFIVQRSKGEMRRVLCPDHRRPMGVMSDDEILRQFIKLEVFLLGGVSDGSIEDVWEINAYLDLDSPAIEPSASLIVARYGVDLTKPYWRLDRWGSSR